MDTVSGQSRTGNQLEEPSLALVVARRAAQQLTLIADSRVPSIGRENSQMTPVRTRRAWTRDIFEIALC